MLVAISGITPMTFPCIRLHRDSLEIPYLAISQNTHCFTFCCHIWIANVNESSPSISRIPLGRSYKSEFYVVGLKRIPNNIVRSWYLNDATP